MCRTVCARRWLTGVSTGTLLIVATNACSDGTGPGSGSLIDAQGGTVMAFGDSLTITIPGGALDSGVRITTARDANPPAATGLVPGTAFELGPSGTDFHAPVTVRIRYDPARIPAGATEADLRLHTYVQGTGWIELPNGSALDTSARLVAGKTTHFSRFAILPAQAASVALSDTALGPMTAMVPRTLVGVAYDAAGVPLVGAPLTLSSINPGLGTVTGGMTVKVTNPGTMRVVLRSGAATDTLLVDIVFGWRSISLSVPGDIPHHGCGVGQDDRVYCWGDNNFMQGGLAGPTVFERPTLVPIAPVVGQGYHLTTGARSTCVLPDPGETYICWGEQRQLGFGQLAMNGTLPIAAAQIPTGLLRLGYAGSCVVSGVGTATCWGNSPGHGAVVDYDPTPLAATPGPWTQIRHGYDVICGTVQTTGAAYCWGGNQHGSSGSGLPPAQYDPYRPNPVASTASFHDVLTSQNFACGLTTTGTVLCWGHNLSGVLGDPITIPESPTPVPAPTGSLTFPVSAQRTSFGVGNSFACGITNSGAAYCWGDGQFGTLGGGGTADAIAASPVAGGHVFSQIAVGAINACGITPYGAAYCWGYNFNGSLGIDEVPLNSAQTVPALLSDPVTSP